MTIPEIEKNLLELQQLFHGIQKNQQSLASNIEELRLQIGVSRSKIEAPEVFINLVS